jgi:signal transduction histidine kinase
MTHWLRPAGLLLAIVLVAIGGALLVAERLMGAPEGDLRLLAVLLAISGAGSLLIGGLVLRLAGARLANLRLRLALASGLGLLLAVVNVLTTSALMFLNAHDLTLLVLLLAFAACVSLSFGVAVAGLLSTELEQLAAAASRLAEGDLGTRIGRHGSDEVGRVAIAFDRMAERLERAFQQQQRLEQERGQLITAVSHDLRTPLATTRAMVEALADGVVTEPNEVQRYLRLIRREIQHLSGLIDDLFELSQIEVGALRLRHQPMEPGQLVEAVVAAYQAPAASLGISLTSSVDAQLAAVRLQADPERLQRVLRNLLDNALRHTPAGGTVAVGARLESGCLELDVSDSGPGIPPEERERVFERFYRGQQARSRPGPDADDDRGSGSGLGLAIARALTEAHAGRLWAEASPLGGARLCLSLPVAARAGLVSDPGVDIRIAGHAGSTPCG